MVTITQARQTLLARRQQIRQARLPEISPAQLRARGREEIIAREREARQLEARKEAAREELIPFEEQITRAEREQIQVSKQADITRTAFEMIRRKAAGKSISLQNEAVRLEFRRILREDSFLRQAVEAGAGFRLQELSFRQAGLTPVIVGGEIKGFEDVIGKQSILAENIGSLGQERLETLERAGIITFTTIPLTEEVDVPDFTPLSIKEQLGNLFFRGKQLVGVVIPGVPLPVISSEEIKTELRKQGIAAGVLASFIPETPKEVLVSGAVVGGLVSLTGIASKIAIGVFSGHGAATALSTELPLEERIAGGIIAVVPLVPFLAKRGFKIKGKKGESVFAQSTFDELGQFFKKKTKTKSELQAVLDDFSNQLKIKRVGKTLRDTTELEKLELTKIVFNKILKTKDPALRKAQTEGFVKLLKAELGKERSDVLFKELLSQEGVRFKQQGVEGQQLVSSIRSEAAKKLIAPPSEAIEVDLLSRTAFNQQRIARAQLSLKEKYALAQLDIIKRKEISKQIQTQQQKISTLLRQKVSQKTIQKERQKLRQLVLQRQAIGQVGRQALAQRQLLKQRLLLRQKQILLQRRVSRQKLARLLRPGKKFIPFLIPGVPKVKKKVKKIPTEIIGAFDVFSKKRGKVIRISKRPFKTRSGARDFGASHVTKTLRASFFVKKSGRVGAKRIPTELEGFFKRNKNQFRPSKVNKKVFVEKRMFRLDSKSEVAAIQKAKRLKKPFSKRL